MFQQIAAITVFLNTVAGANLMCLFCNDAVSPTDCDTVVKCREHERCYVDGYVNSTGTLRYNLGCRDENMCTASSHNRNRDVPFTTTNRNIPTASDKDNLISSKDSHTLRSRKRSDLLICSECCSGTLCSSAGCGYNGYNSTRGPICFNCAEQFTPGDCSKIKQCGQDEVCMLLKTLNPMTHAVRYKSECSTEKTCQSEIHKFNEIASLLVGKRRKRNHVEIGGSCLVQCCTTDICNVNCGNDTLLTSNSTSPMTSSQTRPPTQTTSTQGFTGQPVVTSVNECKDKLSTCGLLDTSFYCSGEYYNFGLDNCQKTCNLCTEHASTTPISVVNSAKWLLFLKGVAGAPGPDLYQLWYSSQTLNPTVPEAKTLTASYNGHYKPDYSNHWKDLCIDQVKVAIYNQGIEKANIIFNATGADKNNWFTPDRIISSTWTDIKTAQKEIFSMAGDASTGREFYVGGHSSSTDSCDSFGWIMVSTKTSCFFEAGDKKPSFYYARGTNQVHWGFTSPGAGDVFSIEARSQCPPTGILGHVTSHPPVCDYKGKQYTQDQFWQDGCQYNCTCLDASIGYYRCRNVCPQYTDLPPDCKLITKPGTCCAEPKCAAIDLPGTTPSPIDGGGKGFCYYKGQLYNQDQTWKDGCTQSCTCTNADQGYYSCRAVCLNWGALPTECHLEDPQPGLCCKQPKCPSGIAINIPKEYKDQYPYYTYV